MAARRNIPALLGGLGGGAAAIALGAVTAFAFWAATDNSNTNVAQSVLNSIPQGATPSTPTTNTPNGNTVTITFAQATTTLGHAPITTYNLRRFPAGGGAPTTVSTSCSSSAGTTTCTKSSVPDGSWKYTDAPNIGTNWVGLDSGKSAAVTVDTTAPAVAVAYPVTSTIYGTNWSGTISGTSSDATSGVASVAVALEDTTAGKWWNGSSFTPTVQTFVPVTSGTTSWSLTMAGSKLTSGHAYSVVGQATDGAGNVGSSPAVTFTYNTSPPTVAVTYPVTTSIYGANWTGAITGTASSNSASALASASVALEDTTAGKWWNGSSFTPTVQTFVPVTSGTTSWSLTMAGSKLTSGHAYSVVGQATDGAGNVGSSPAVTFTYNTSPPTVAVTYPVTTSIYGQPTRPAPSTGAAELELGLCSGKRERRPRRHRRAAESCERGPSFTPTVQTFVPVTSGTTSWSLTMAGSKLTSGHAYSVVGQATDGAGNVGSSPAVTFTYNTSPPTVAVTYPVTTSIYGANWTGAITGTATAHSGSAVLSATVALEDTTAGMWWNGTSFASCEPNLRAGQRNHELDPGSWAGNLTSATATA